MIDRCKVIGAEDSVEQIMLLLPDTVSHEHTHIVAATSQYTAYSTPEYARCS